jgi:hypothetical protein
VHFTDIPAAWIFPETIQRILSVCPVCRQDEGAICSNDCVGRTFSSGPPCHQDMSICSRQLQPFVIPRKSIVTDTYSRRSYFHTPLIAVFVFHCQSSKSQRALQLTNKKSKARCIFLGAILNHHNKKCLSKSLNIRTFRFLSDKGAT